ncbi:prolyl 4-hydroxylase subunit alpha-3 [Conger conger]|uniref:prolyl 4-hydroxylase subunit alpha-3 n=1 Tax=Conger conger TaxID=82655 RepID=UPI002A5A564C|nr:prolyl 4-hydroxylase subunit alpha-3 [Conger conger]
MSVMWIEPGTISIDWKIITVWSVINLFFVPPLFGEMYTSVKNMQQAISVEKELLNHLRTYIQDETLRLNDIKRFYAKISDLHSEVYSGPETAMANPLVAFTLIKRLQSEWMNVVYSNEAKENVQAFRAGYEKEESRLPKFEDLQGAAKGLMRLQDVYSLHMDGLVNGHFQTATDGATIDIYKPAVSMPLSGDDCFLVGKVAYEQEDYYHSVQWLEEAARLFRREGGEWVPENEGTIEDTLDHLAFSHFKTGNVSYALSLSQELLRYDPSNIRVLRNVEKYENLLVTSPTLDSPEAVLQRPNTTYLITRNTYEWLCQTRGSQPKHYENARLFCDYFTNGSPSLLLKPMRREVVSTQPYVVLFHSFVTNGEAKSIRELAQPGLSRSVVASGEKQATAEYRISKSAWLKETAHPVVGRVDQRITALTGLNLQPPYAEYLQVVNYGIGGHYEPHFDHATSASSPLYRLKTGNRVATFMIYLSSVAAGGSTAFIHANFSIPVVENAALFWWNLHRNGRGDGDTLHAGCPVLIGDKWVANKWVHEHGQEFQRRCSPNPEE